MKITQYVLRLYPRTWRERYEEEFLAMLEQRPISFLDGIDLCFGALDAHLHPELGTTGMSLYERMRHMLSTLRHSLLTLFCAYIGFVIAGIAFQKMTEYNIFVAAAQAHSVVGAAFTLVIIGAVVALLAVLVGGAPIAFAVIRYALAQKRRGLLLLLATPVIALAVFFGALFFLEKLPVGNPLAPSSGEIVARTTFVVLFLGAALVSTGAVCFAIARSEIPEKLLRFAMLPSFLATIAMALMLVATLVWGLGLRNSVPQLFRGNDGIVGLSTTGTWLGIVVAMAIATGLAAISLVRGFSARSTLRTAA